MTREQTPILCLGGCSRLSRLLFLEPFFDGSLLVYSASRYYSSCSGRLCISAATSRAGLLRLLACILISSRRLSLPIHTTQATARTNTDSLSAPWRLQSPTSFEAAKPHGFWGCQPAQPPGCEVVVFDSVPTPNPNRLADRGTATPTTRQQVFTTGRDDAQTNSDTSLGRL